MLFEFGKVFLSEIILKQKNKIMRKFKTNKTAIIKWSLNGLLSIFNGLIGTLTGGLHFPTDSLIPEK